MNDGSSLVRCIVGPIGSGKSMACIMELLRRATEQAPDDNGKRNTRFAIIRNTSQQLRTTVLVDIRQYLGPMQDYYTTDSTVRIRVPLPDGTTVVSDWLLIPLDTEEDQKRLLSMQLTGAWINEVREVPFKIIDPLIGRLGRYPSKAMGGPSWHGLIMDTNPWDTDSPYHEVFVLNPPRNWTLYHQPSGIGPEAENVENLPLNYYENLASRGEEWAAVHIESHWGTSNAGQAVFRRSFHAPTHVRDMKAIVNPMRPLIVGMDFGRTPTALVGQIDSMGRLLIFKEVTTEDCGLIQMLEEHLKPVLFNEPFAGKRVFVIADPAGKEKSQVTEQSAFDALKDQGFIAYPAPSNKIAPRLTAVESILRKTIGGAPALQLSREGCPTLVRALGNKYRYRRRAKDGQLEDVPEKLHPWSDVADCLQYMCMGANADYVGRVMARLDRPRFSQSERMSSAGWT